MQTALGRNQCCRREAASFDPLTFCSTDHVEIPKVGRGEGEAATLGRPNGSEVHLRGQGPRGYGSAARRLPAFEARDAGGVTPLKYR